MAAVAHGLAAQLSARALPGANLLAGLPDVYAVSADNMSLVGELGLSDQQPGELRRAARTVVTLWGLDVLADSVALVVSELVTNAVQHGGGFSHFRITRCAISAVRIEVGQDSVGSPLVLPPNRDGQTGRGMFLVQSVADAWGVSEDGTTVWCLLTVQSLEQGQ